MRRFALKPDSKATVFEKRRDELISINRENTQDNNESTSINAEKKRLIFHFQVQFQKMKSN